MLHCNLSDSSIGVAKDIQLPDDDVNRHGVLVPDILLKGEFDDVVREEREAEAKGAQGKTWCLARDKVGRAFAHNDKEEDIIIAVDVGPARAILEGGRPGVVGRGGSMVCSGSWPGQSTRR